MNAGELAITHGSALEDPVVAVTGIAIVGDALEAGKSYARVFRAHDHMLSIESSDDYLILS